MFFYSHVVIFFFFFFHFKVKRDDIVNNTLEQVAREVDNLKKPLKVKFIDEDGVDEGGVQKEFFQIMTRQLFDPNYGKIEFFFLLSFFSLFSFFFLLFKSFY